MPRPTPHRMDRDDAETVALQALTYLVSDPQRLSRFLSLTGIGLEDLRSEAITAELQIATLEYMLSDESLLLTFCQEVGIEPMMIAPAHALLSGYQI